MYRHPEGDCDCDNKKTPWACVAVIAPQTPMPMASVTTWTTAWGIGRVRRVQWPGEIFECGCADIPERNCDCDGNQEDALGVCGGDCALTPTAMASATTRPLCGRIRRLQVCNGQAKSMSADVLTFQKANATAIATSWMNAESVAERNPEGLCDCEGNVLVWWAIVVVTAFQMSTTTESVT